MDKDNRSYEEKNKHLFGKSCRVNAYPIVSLFIRPSSFLS